MSAGSANTPRSLSRSLGVASFGLGVTELLAPKGVLRLSGVPATARSVRTVRALGLRECGHGAAILLGSPKLVWTRVAGDVLDVGALLKGLSWPGARRKRGLATAGALAVVGAADVYAAAGELRERP